MSILSRFIVVSLRKAMWCLSISIVAIAHVEGADQELGFIVVDSVAELQACFAQSGQKVRMRPGTYRVAQPVADAQTVFAVSGSNNHFDLRGVTIEIDTQMLADMRGKVQSLHVYLVSGSGNTLEGGRFEDVGDQAPYRGLNDFYVTGDGNEFRDCTFVTRGSKPYGYGELFGKGRDHDVPLQKHSGMSVQADDVRIVGCRFEINTFGHAVSIHGAQRTHFERVDVTGALRSSDEILAETSGPAFERGFRDHFDRPLESDRMICLAEDGIRAYFDGERDGKTRRTGDVTVVDCTVRRMRGGITLALAAGKIRVAGCTVTECGYPGHSYSLPSNAVVRSSKGDAAYVPLLQLGYSTRRHADVELELLDAPRYSDHDVLARINGTGHRVKIVKPDGKPLAAPLKIVCGQTYRNDERDVDATFARGIRLTNDTPQPVELSELATDCRVFSRGPLADHGRGTIVLTEEPTDDGAK